MRRRMTYGVTMPKKVAGRDRSRMAQSTAAMCRLDTEAATASATVECSKPVRAVPHPAKARMAASRARETVRSAMRPPSQAPRARQARTTPMRLVQTMTEVPRCGAMTLAPTISRTMTRAPLTRAISSSMGLP